MASPDYVIQLGYAPTPLDSGVTVVDVLQQILVASVADKKGFGVAELRGRVAILQRIDRALEKGAVEVRLAPDQWRFLRELLGVCSFTEARPVFLAAVDAVLEAMPPDTQKPNIAAIEGGAS